MPRGGARPGAGRKKKPPVDAAALNSPASENSRPAHLFKPGQSGNPGGRPKGERAYLQKRYGEDAASLHERLDRLLDHAKTPPHVKADILKFKLERHSGKAAQPVNVDGPMVPLFALPAGVMPSVSQERGE